MRPSKRAQKYIDAFSEAAKSHGWMEDQGTGNAVTNAEQNFIETKVALERFVSRLERKTK